MNEFLQKDVSGNWNTIPAIPSEMLSNVNCHKFVLYVLKKISYHEMISNPKFQREAKPFFDFTYQRKVASLSNRNFTKISTVSDLYALANKEFDSHKICIGQVRDVTSNEIAHSFIIEKVSADQYTCYEKTGFKDYPFAIKELGSLLDFVNEKGEKSYQNQEWRFIPRKEIEDVEVCPICYKPYSERNKKVTYHLQYKPVAKFIYACRSCNHAEYLSRHWKRHLTPWQWRKIKIVRKFGKEFKHLVHY